MSTILSLTLLCVLQVLCSVLPWIVVLGQRRPEQTLNGQALKRTMCAAYAQLGRSDRATSTGFGAQKANDFLRNFNDVLEGFIEFIMVVIEVLVYIKTPSTKS